MEINVRIKQKRYHSKTKYLENKFKKYLNYFIKREMKVNLQTNVTIYNTKKK